MTENKAQVLDQTGQANVAAAAIGAIVGVIGIIIFANIYDSLNKDKISTASKDILDLIDLVLAAVLIVGIVLVLTTLFR